MRRLIFLVLIAGCGTPGYSNDQILAAHQECEALGMEVYWLHDMYTQEITGHQCVPTGETGSE